MLRFAIGGTLAAVVLLAAAETSIGQEDVELVLDHSSTPATWNDLPNEDSYRVFGHILYQQEHSCGPNTLSLGSERVEFDEMLPANTTAFSLPGPSDPRLTWAKSGDYQLEALGADGSRIDLEAFGWTADGFCTPEDIAAELAAAGTGFVPSSDRSTSFAIAALLAVGAVCLTAALAIKRAA